MQLSTFKQYVVYLNTFSYSSYSSHIYPMAKHVKNYRRMRIDSSLALAYLMSSSANSLSFQLWLYYCSASRQMKTFVCQQQDHRSLSTCPNLTVLHFLSCFIFDEHTLTQQTDVSWSPPPHTHLFLTLQHTLYHSLIHIRHISAY